MAAEAGSESSGGAWPHRESIAIRYQEVDLQNVVFNAHYMAFCDMAFSSWLQEAIGWTGVDDPDDWMLVKATIEWQGSATYGDILDVDCGVARWGTTSFDVAYRGTVDGRPVFTATVTYVTVEPGTKQKRPVPESMRSALGAAPAR
jgi:acyl-CoA thioester hydrolase